MAKNVLVLIFTRFACLHQHSRLYKCTSKHVYSPGAVYIPWLLLSSLTLYAFVIAWYISWYIRKFLCLIYKVKCKQLRIVWEALGSAYLLLLLSQRWISHCAKNIWSLLSIERFHFKASIRTKNVKQNNDNEKWIRVGGGFIINYEHIICRRTGQNPWREK